MKAADFGTKERVEVSIVTRKDLYKNKTSRIRNTVTAFIPQKNHS